MSTNIKYFYLRDSKCNNRVATFARSLFKEDGEEGKATLKFAFAITFPGRKDEWNDEVNGGDQFVKKIGREISTGRLAKHPTEIELTKDVLPVVAMLKSIAKSDNPEIPHSLKKMASEWLADNETKKPSSWK